MSLFRGVLPMVVLAVVSAVPLDSPPLEFKIAPQIQSRPHPPVRSMEDSLGVSSKRIDRIGMALSNNLSSLVGFRRLP